MSRMSRAVKIRLKFSKWFSEAKTEEEVKEIYSTILEEADEAREDRMFEFMAAETGGNGHEQNYQGNT